MLGFSIPQTGKPKGLGYPNSQQMFSLSCIWPRIQVTRVALHHPRMFPSVGFDVTFRGRRRDRRRKCADFVAGL